MIDSQNGFLEDAPGGANRAANAIRGLRNWRGAV
jgi:hypothetical protein